MGNAEIEKLMAATQKEHGAGSFLPATQSRATYGPRILTDIFALDYATGGGIPIGRTTEIVGKRSSGKMSVKPPRTRLKTGSSRSVSSRRNPPES